MAEIDALCITVQSLVVIGVALRVIICLIKISLNPDQKEQLIPRIKNALIFMAFGICVFSLKDLILKYFFK